MKKSILAIAVAALFISLPFLTVYYFPAWAADCSEPPFITTGIQSNVLFILDNSGSMTEFAYKEAQGTFGSAGATRTCSFTSSQCSGQPNCPTWNNTNSSTCQSHSCTDTWTYPNCAAGADWGDPLYSFTCTFVYDCRWTSSSRTCTRRLASKTCVCTNPADESCPESWGWSSSSGGSSTQSQVTVTVTNPNSGINGSAFYGYDRTKKYYGLFDPDKTYKYDNTKHYFYTQDGWNVVDPGGNGYRGAGTDTSNDKFSGNWLNWLTSRRIDVAKKVLTGGRLGGDPDEYVLVGTPGFVMPYVNDKYKMFNDNGGDGVYYTPFQHGFIVQFYNKLDKAPRTGTNGKFVPLFVFFRANFSAANYATILGTLEDANLGNRSEYGNLGEPDYAGSTKVKEYPGSYYFAVKHSTVAQNTPPLGIIQNMASKVRIGFMHFNHGYGPQEGRTLGGAEFSVDIDGDGTIDHVARYADGARVLNRVGDDTRITSWQGQSIYKMVQNVNEMLASTYTPLSETLQEARNYFRQATPCYSWRDNDNNPQVDFKIGQQTEDGKTVNWDPYEYPGIGKQPCAKSYIILVSDGEPTQDTPKTTGCGNPVGMSFRFNGTGYLDDIAYQMFTQDQRTDVGSLANPPINQTISLYTVFCFDESLVGKDQLSRAALAGGFDDLNKDGQPGKPLPGGCSSNTWLQSYDCPGYDGYYEWDVNNDRKPDHYFEAQDGYQLESQIQSIFSQVALGGAAGAVATISQQTKEGDAIIRGAFDAVDVLDRTRYVWNGRLEVYWPFTEQCSTASGEQCYEFEVQENIGVFCAHMEGASACAMPDPVTGRCCWDAAERLKALSNADRADQTKHTVFTYIPSRAAADRKTDFIPENWRYLQPLMREAHSTPFREGVPDEAKVKAIVRWTRGVVNDQGAPLDDSGNPYPGSWRDRKRYLLGDIVYSTPVIVGPPPLASVSSADKDLVRAGDSYHDGVSAFWDFRNHWLDNPVEGAYKGRPKVAYVGANDGMLHAFLIARLKQDGQEWVWDYKCSAEGSYPACGSELWSYIPSNMLGELVALSDTNYGSQAGCKHRSMVDLSPKAWDVFIKSDDCGTTGRPAGCSNRCWRTIIIGGERGGGDTYFAMDVTDPLQPKVLWEHSVLKNLAVAYDEGSNTRIALPFRENDASSSTTTCPSTDGWMDTWPDSCFDDMYFRLKTLPMSWTKAVLGRVRIPSDVQFYRWKPSGDAAADVYRSPVAPTLEATGTFTDCDNKRHIAFIGTGFQIFDFGDLTGAAASLPDTIKKALTKPYLLALDVETGENYFQVLWPLAVKARTDAGLLPDQHMPLSDTTSYIPWAFGSPSLVDVWSNQDHEATATTDPTNPDTLHGTFAEDGFVDRLYIGDMRGFMHRMIFNLKEYGTLSGTNYKGMHVEFWPTKPIPAASTPNNVSTCDQTNNYRGCRQPIQSAPAISYDAGTTATTNPKLRVLFGTGKFDKAGVGSGNDKTDMTKMSFYNLVDEIKSFHCSTVDGERVCQDALPEITGGTYSLEVDAAQITALVSGGGATPQNGFVLGGTNFGFTFGEGACQSETTAPYDFDKYRGCTESDPFPCDEATKLLVCGDDQACRDTCNTVTREKCCDWKKAGTNGAPDCCQGDCTPPVCDTSTPTKCRPCWDCIFDFGVDGERVIGDPLIAYGYVFFTTYIPTTTACSAGGHGWLYVLDYRCKSLGAGQNPVTGPIGRTVISLPDFGAKVDLGAGMASEPVMDSQGNILVQMSNATLIRIPPDGGGDGGGGGGGSFRDIQFKGWDRK